MNNIKIKYKITSNSKNLQILHEDNHLILVNKRSVDLVQGDKTGDTLKGALLGGIIGNNIKGEQDGGAIGAIIGGMLGHANSNSSVGTRNVCTRETRYKETEKTIYSHSTITFLHEGVTYMLRFNKK